jgi:hypothetical protein
MDELRDVRAASGIAAQQWHRTTLKEAIPRTASREVSRILGAAILLLPVIFIRGRSHV